MIKTDYFFNWYYFGVRAALRSMTMSQSQKFSDVRQEPTHWRAMKIVLGRFVHTAQHHKDELQARTIVYRNLYFWKVHLDCTDHHDKKIVSPVVFLFVSFLTSFKRQNYTSMVTLFLIFICAFQLFNFSIIWSGTRMHVFLLIRLLHSS